MFSFVDPSLTIEKTASVWWCVAGDTRKLCDHSFLSASGLTGWSDLLNALGFSVAFLWAMGLSKTASSWKLQVSDSDRSTSPDSSFFATGFPVAVSMNPPRCVSCSRTWELDVSWFLFCSDKFLRGCVHQPAMVCILQPHLRTRRCVGFRISPHPAFKFLRSYEHPRTFGCNRTSRGWGTCRNMWRQVRRCRSRFWHTSLFSLLFVHPLCHCGAAYQAGILCAASRAEMADVEQMKKIVPFVTREITFSQNDCELMFGINVPNLNFRIKICPVKQPIKRNSVGSWHMSHCGTSAFDYHLKHGFNILKDIQQSIGTRMCSVWWKVVNVGQIETGVRGWKMFSYVWLRSCRQVYPWRSRIFGFVGLVWCVVFGGMWSMYVGMTLVCLIGMGLSMFDLTIADGFPSGSLLGPSVLFGSEWNTSITKSQRSRAGIPSMRKPASRKITSASVELCETEVCFLHIQLLGKNVWLPKMHRVPPDVDFESSGSPAKSESWNSPSLHCCAVLPT